MPQPRLPALRVPPIGFAHRGASARAPENTLEAFALALELGATGLESDAWLTADGVVVLDHDGMVNAGGLRRPVREFRRDELPAHIPTLEELYAAMGRDYELSLDVKDARAALPSIEVAARCGDPERLWLCHPDWRVAVDWRGQARGRARRVKLVDSTRLERIEEGAEARARDLARTGIDAINLHHSDWSGALTDVFHAEGRFAFAWDLQREEVLWSVLLLGVDAVYSDHVDRMMSTLRSG